MVGDNASVGTQRKGTYNPATKVTPGYQNYLSGLSCHIRDTGNSQRARGFAVEYDLELTCELSIDLQPNDLVTGWNPANLSPAPVYFVKHVQVDAGGLGAHRVAFLSAFRG